MNATVQCLIFLVCATICSAAPFIGCRCVNVLQYVKPLLINEVTEIPPRPYCRKQEAIVKLKNGKTLCLDPTKVQEILEERQKQMAAQTEKMNSISSKAIAETNTVSAVASASAAASAPATATTTPATLSS